MRRALHLSLSLFSLLFAANLSLAQETPAPAPAPPTTTPAATTEPAPWPSQTVRLVTAASAGSQSDILARAFSDHLAKRWGRDVIVENRPGLPGNASVAKATPDGHTLLLAANGHTLIRALNRNLNFDPVKDFTGVTKVASLPGVLVVNPESGPKSLQQLLLNARANPGRYNYASAGLASASSIAVELLKTEAGIDLVHVPFKGLPDAHIAVMRNDVLLAMTFLSTSADLIESGKMRAIAIAGNKRMTVLPNIPTVAESGVPSYNYDAWFGLLAPAGTPSDTIMKIHAGFVEVAKLQSITAHFAKLGVDVMTSSPDEMDALLRSDTERYSRIFTKFGEKK